MNHKAGSNPGLCFFTSAAAIQREKTAKNRSRRYKINTAKKQNREKIGLPFASFQRFIMKESVQNIQQRSVSNLIDRQAAFYFNFIRTQINQFNLNAT